MKLTKEQFNRIYDENIPKKEYDAIIDLVDKRFSDVVLLVYPNICKKGWFVYGNYDYHSETDEGYFDIINYRENISIGGDCGFPEPYCFDESGGNGYIPTRWLWTDDVKILEEFNQVTQKAKEAKEKLKTSAKQKRAELKINKAKFKQIIQSKLTSEELKYIKFK